MRTSFLIPVLVLALAGGCSSESPSASKGTPNTPRATAGEASQTPAAVPDPCSLLTTADIDTASGHSFGAGAPNTAVSHDGISACDWQGPGAGTVQVLTTTIDAYESSKETAATVYGPTKQVQVPGALRAYALPGGFLIGMDMGAVFVQVSYISTTTNVADTVLKLAAKAAGRVR